MHKVNIKVRKTSVQRRIDAFCPSREKDSVLL